MNKQKRNPGRRQKTSVIRILTGVLLGLLVILSFALFFAVAERRSTYANEYSYMIRALERGDYPEAAKMAMENEVQGVKSKEDTTEFGYFAAYYEASMLYSAYQKTGEKEKAAAQKKIMDENYGRLTEAELIRAADQLRD
ncbi:MAG: hypothetical protein Q4B22_04985 [Eubacteriales bacterium]|nr:hypothetical protein [Eubacteriales bacterium]